MGESPEYDHEPGLESLVFHSYPTDDCKVDITVSCMRTTVFDGIALYFNVRWMLLYENFNIVESFHLQPLSVMYFLSLNYTHCFFQQANEIARKRFLPHLSTRSSKRPSWATSVIHERQHRLSPVAGFLRSCSRHLHFQPGKTSSTWQILPVLRQQLHSVVSSEWRFKSNLGGYHCRQTPTRQLVCIYDSIIMHKKWIKKIFFSRCWI